MNRTKKTLIAGASALAIAAGATGVAFGTGSNSPNTPQNDPTEQASGAENDSAEQVTGSGADKAKAAALKITGGTANAVERDSENGATWEVEVTKPDGTTVDVRLDENYKLVVIESDSE